MNAFDHNGAAFPHQEKDDRGAHMHTHSGMTLRDWFAGQALAGLATILTGGVTIPGLASEAYEFADAMLDARRAKFGFGKKE